MMAIRLDSGALSGKNEPKVRYSLPTFRFFFVSLALYLAACGTTYGVYHSVAPGETLYGIGQSYGVSPQEIQIVNGMDGETVIAGSQLFIPGADRTRSVGTRTPTPTNASPYPRSSLGPPPLAPEAGGYPPTSPGSTMPGRSAETVEIARVKPDEVRRPAVPSSRDGAKFRWPVATGSLFSPYGKRNGLQHDGIDISAPEGTQIFSAADGRVIYSGDGVSGYGNLIIVKHEGAYATVYAHNRENLVQKGDFVSSGQVIATVGMTGRASGPHLHFEIRRSSKPVDPFQYYPR